MGWLYLNLYNETPKQYLTRLYTCDNQRERRKVLDIAIAKRRTAYLAVERIRKDTGQREVFAVVCKLDYSHPQGYNFGYKNMDETMGPVERECPERILRLLTPLPKARVYYPLRWERDYKYRNRKARVYRQAYGSGQEVGSYKYVREWRRDCWQNIERHKAQPKLREGLRIRFQRPILFTDGYQWQTFEVERYGKRSWLFRPVLESGRASSYYRYRITDIKDRSFEVVQEAA